jgi:hypothetical protein
MQQFDSATLRIVTFPQDPEPVLCDGTYTCACDHCIEERAVAVRKGVRPRRNPGLPRAA